MTAIAVGVYQEYRWIFADAYVTAGFLQRRMNPRAKTQAYDDAFLAMTGDATAEFPPDWRTAEASSHARLIAVTDAGEVLDRFCDRATWQEYTDDFICAGSGEDVLTALVVLGYADNLPIDRFLETLVARFEQVHHMYASFGPPCYTDYTRLRGV